METTKKIEIRQNKMECRVFEGEDGKKGIEGYALLYDHESRLISTFWDGQFYETIKRGAFDKVLASSDLNVKYKYNHGVMIARTKSGTLKLESDERGLKYTIPEIPDTTDANNLYEQIKRGNVFESSFAFMVADSGQNWSKREDGADLRTIVEASYLDDVSSVDDGAYANTEVAVRSLKANSDLLELDDDYLIDLEIKERELKLKKLNK